MKGTLVLEDLALASPFPGMNPYFEQAAHWQDFHIEFLTRLRRMLAPVLASEFIIRIEEHVNFPAQTLEPIRFLEIWDQGRGDSVTVIELLCPSQKRSESDREHYLAQHRVWLGSPAHLIEIDLLRGGAPMPEEDRLKGDYSVLISRAECRPTAKFWPIRLRERLPEIPIPLRAPDPDCPLDLQEVLQRAYDDTLYKRYIYSRGAPEPPLSAEDAEWSWQFVPSSV